MTRADLLALAAILLWASLAALGVSLSHVPPLLLTGLGLLVGSLIALPLSGGRLAAWRVPLPTLALGVYGLFGFHLLLFMALRSAPPLQANLVNYLWPLGMVVLAPLILPGVRLRAGHVGAALMGFAGAAVVILGRGNGAALQGGWHGGYALALCSAFVWSTYSLGTRRVAAFPTAAVGSFAAVSGVLALLAHAVLEPTPALSLRDGLLIAGLGLGPLGGAFFLWDAALKQGDPRRIGLLSFLTPLLSTLVVALTTGQALSASVALGAALIVGGAVWGSRTRGD
ncbi:DMT family transporter [Ideonella livida]|uniref:DMT family transporter n=1 Tax=Ideonella livida TaxID=2707176 RepID=A0A7C9TNI8_9BURK|nr:DMT family transporter [Ideonella livida]NDY92506.1 DMT family transporter [Ideonella livida]